MASVATAERIEANDLRQSIIADGEAVIMTRGELFSWHRSWVADEVNVLSGTSTAIIRPEDEVRKARIAESVGADTITDLSAGGDIPAIRRAIFFRHHHSR